MSDDPFDYISALHGVTPRARLAASPRPTGDTEPMNEQNEHGVTPQTGQPARYVLADGQVRAATITNAFGTDRVNLTVHLDQINDVDLGEVVMNLTYDHLADMDRPVPAGEFNMSVTPFETPRAKAALIPQGARCMRNGTLAVGSASYDPAGTTPGTWHYPERA